MIDEHEEIRKYIRDNDKRIEELEIKVESLKDVEQSFVKEIAELKDNFDDHTHLVWFNKIKELEEEDDHIKHIINVNRTGVSNLFTNYGVIKEVLRELGKEIVEYFQGDFRENEIEAIDNMCNNINKLLAKLSGSGGEKPPEPALEEKFIKTISNPKLHWYYKTPKGEGFLDEPREDDVINIREMVKTLTNKEWVLVKREDLQWLTRILTQLIKDDDYYTDSLRVEFRDKNNRIKEEYSL